MKNPKKLKFKELEAPCCPALADVDLALINTNYAIESQAQTPAEDALFIEGADSPYTNIVAARKDRAEGADIAKLMKALHSPETKQFILDKYQGAVVPAFVSAARQPTAPPRLRQCNDACFVALA